MVVAISSMGVKDHFQTVKLTLKEPALIPIVDTERGGESVLSCSLLIFTLQNKLLAVLIHINLYHSM